MRIIKFQACIEYKDIHTIEMLDVPDPDTTNSSFGTDSDYYIQIVLKDLGTTKIDP